MRDLLSHNGVEFEVGHDVRIVEEFSNASGTKSGRNAVCRTGCNFKRKSKRGKCWSDCDKKFPPSIKQKEKRQDLSDRRDARTEKKEGKQECKERYESGELTAKQFRDCKQSERKEKRAKVKEAGGNFLVRAGRTFAKVFPVTLAGRGGATMLIQGNAFGFATRIAPALLPRVEAEKKFKSSSIEKAKKGWVKLQKAWINIGGNPEKLKKAILKGYKKKPTKVSKKSKFNGIDEYSYTSYSSVEGVTWATAITTGITVLTTLLNLINKSGVDKNPFKEGQTPSDYARAMQDGDLNEPPQDLNAPALDPITGKWIDPKTGKEIDPLTGEYTNEILGMNKWLVIGLSVAVLGGVAFLILKPKK